MFCTTCGTDLSSWGEASDQPIRFCPQCGSRIAPLAGGTPALHAERRVPISTPAVPSSNSPTVAATPSWPNPPSGPFTPVSEPSVPSAALNVGRGGTSQMSSQAPSSPPSVQPPQPVSAPATPLAGGGVAPASSDSGFVPIGPGATLERGYGRMVVQTRVGEGGMGVVWRGWLFYPPGGPRGGEPPVAIALKVLRSQIGAREDVRAFFRNEAEALRVLSHPNIVRFFDLFEWPPHPPSPPPSRPETPSLALAMEYVDGDTLEQVIARHVARAQLRGPGALPGMPFRRAWYYFQQLLGALAATHALGIVHRDVKPSNILIRRDGIVKLTDYGIARMNQPNGPDESGLAPGTGAYMSPEQVLSQPVDGRSDLYSAAIVLYEMLSGRTPFSTDNKSEFWIRQEQVQRSPPPIRTWVAQAPPVLDALFFRALAKDKAMRFDNAIEMGNAFREAMGIADSAEWRAQAEIAREAVPAQAAPTAEAERQARLGTLRDFLIKKYPTLGMTAA